jgi:predicted  nucleic acid-binding Zn-ribbon protein
MAKKTEITVEEKLRALFDLQLIDSRIDKIRDIRGELPLEVEDLEDELAGMNTRLEKLNDGVDAVMNSVSDKKNQIEESKELIKK